MASTTELVAHLIDIAKRFALDEKDLSTLCTKVIVLSLKYVHRKELWSQLYGDANVDWPLVEQQNRNNVVGGCAEWLNLLHHLEWPKLNDQEAVINANYPVLTHLRTNVKECGLDTGSGNIWTVVCKMMILLMVQSLPSAYCIEMYTCQLFKISTTAKCKDFMAKHGEVLFTQEEYLHAFVLVFRNAGVDKNLLENSLIKAKHRMEEQKRSLSQSRLMTVQGRPSLKERVQNLYRTEERVLQVDAMLQTWDSFAGFCYKHQFPTTLSDKVKSNLYFMACQTRWSWENYLPQVVKLSEDMMRRVVQHKVAIPDAAVIQRVIQGLSMQGSAPFPELTDFRRGCFGSFPVSHIQKIPLTVFLQLYVSGYQPESIWRDCWRSVIGVISNQIIMDVEAFVKSRPFAASAVVVLLTGE